MPRIVVDAKLTGPVFNGKHKDIWRKEYRNAVQELVITGETLVAENTPVGVSGQLRSGIQGKVVRHNLGVVRAVGPGAIYVDAVEGGRRAGGRFPPVEPIMLWVKRVLRPPPGQLKSVAYLVGRKIAKKGIQAKKMFAKAEIKMARRVQRRLEIANVRISRLLSG